GPGLVERIVRAAVSRHFTTLRYLYRGLFNPVKSAWWCRSLRRWARADIKEHATIFFFAIPEKDARDLCDGPEILLAHCPNPGLDKTERLIDGNNHYSSLGMPLSYQFHLFNNRRILYQSISSLLTAAT